MLSEIFAWWARQMLALLPNRPDPGNDLPPDALVVQADPSGGPIALIRRERRVERPLASLAADQAGFAAIRAAAPAGRRLRPVVLDIPAAHLLERETTLPLAAEADLDRVLGYEMDRITPFPADDLFWSWRLVRRDRPRALLHVRLSLVRRAAVQDLLDMMRDAGAAPAMLRVAAADGAARTIPLLPTTRKQRAGRTSLRLAAATCAVLALAVLATPVFRTERAIAAADARIAALRPQVAQVDALRRRIAAAASGADAFAAEAARLGSPLRAIAALTEVLPDDTWLMTLSLRKRQLTFSGQSARAARLIAALSSDPTLRNPTFLTPVTRADTAGGDLFSIRAELGL